MILAFLEYDIIEVLFLLRFLVPFLKEFLLTFLFFRVPPLEHGQKLHLLLADYYLFLQILPIFAHFVQIIKITDDFYL